MQVDTAHPYSLVRRTRRGAYLSGVLPYRTDGSLARERDSAIDAALDTLRRRLADAGYTLADVAKTTVFLTDMGWLPALNDAWARAFAEPRPARTAVEVRALPRGAPIEIDAVVEPVD
ncbi:MAG TPA: RidA family protein, partial [Acidimicrobiales bacterium]